VSYISREKSDNRMSGISSLLSDDERSETNARISRDMLEKSNSTNSYEDSSLFDYTVNTVKEAPNDFEPATQELTGQRELFEGQEGYLLIDPFGEESVSIQYGEEQNLNNSAKEPLLEERVDSTLDARLYISKVSQLDRS